MLRIIATGEREVVAAVGKSVEIVEGWSVGMRLFETVGEFVGKIDLSTRDGINEGILDGDCADIGNTNGLKVGCSKG